jgi:hypothetical protein
MIKLVRALFDSIATKKIYIFFEMATKNVGDAQTRSIVEQIESVSTKETKEHKKMSHAFLSTICIYLCIALVNHHTLHH